MLAMPLLPHAVPAGAASRPCPPPISGRAPPEAAFAPVADAPPSEPRGGSVSAPSHGMAVPAAPASSSRSVSRAALGAYLYLAGLIASLVYVGAGWLAMTAIVRRSRPVALADGSVACESAIVAAPLTAGVFKPRIVLPAAWRAWSAATLHAVVTHERAHIVRRDPLFALVARLNRCVFWFHPLAWWLERKLAAVAEFACDETASRACGAPADYARVLVDIADDVRRNGGRLAWQGIAVSGNGQLKDRIERLLAGTPWPATSRGKKALVASACVLAVAIAAACRPAAHAQTLTPDPLFAARRAEEKARTARDYEARRMTPAQVAALEAAVVRNPDDRESREKLLLYYGDFQRTLDPAGILARRAHVLWMTERHPDVDTMSSWWLRLYPTHEDPNADPAGYEQAKRLWLAHMARPGVSIQILTNAARFFEVADKPLAEAAYLQAAEREPGKWSGELGRLYALTIIGSDASMPLNVIRHASMAAAHSPYAEQVAPETRRLDRRENDRIGGSGLRLRIRISAQGADGRDEGRDRLRPESGRAEIPGSGAPVGSGDVVGGGARPWVQELGPEPARAGGFQGRLQRRHAPGGRRASGSERLDVLWRLIREAYDEGASLRNTGKEEDKSVPARPGGACRPTPATRWRSVRGIPNIPMRPRRCSTRTCWKARSPCGTAM